MEVQDEYKEFVLTVLTEDTPLTLWQRLGEKSRFTYGESFSGVAGDVSLLDEQRMQKLFQERYFKMEHALITTAKESGVRASAKLIGINLCYYAYAARGRIGFTQSYVQISGEMPSPAAFRKQLAEMAAFERDSRLDLGDEPSELLLPKKIRGIILHSPVGRNFTENDQALGAIGLFVPYRDYSGWAVELSFNEIISAYKPVEMRDDRAAPVRKKIEKTGTEE